jgi:predicted Zn-dependent protease with MMP-like domain
MRWSPPGAEGDSADGDAADSAAADDAFGGLVVAALDALPDVFRDRLGSVAIVIEDEPTGEQLRSVGAHGLYGLYQGVPRTSWAAESAPYASKITIFRGPLSRAARTPEDLATRVTETVHHEIAHHFGISDDRLRELARARR